MSHLTRTSPRWIRFTALGFAAFSAVIACLAIGKVTTSRADEATDKKLPAYKLLFLGDKSKQPHEPPVRYNIIKPVLAKHNITVDYTDKLDDINPTNLANYDGLIVYANIDRITPEAEKALLDYVNGGKGFIPLHCASACFGNSPDVIAMIGGKFLRHSTGVFRTELASTDLPIMKGFNGFESWDETYVHTKHNEKDRTVLEYRVDNQGREPFTWIRTQGKGRVFYTAWGHDERTWNNPGFQNLVERGIRWAVGGDPTVVGASPELPAAKRVGADRKPFARPEMTAAHTDVKPFEYDEADIPYYPPTPTPGGPRTTQLHKMQKPLEPAESQKHLIVPEGFEAQLFASEPDIGKALCMAWDERGRLWLSDTVDYPNAPQAEGYGHDRIRILEDTDGDGKADKFTTFAEHLSIPTSICFANGGVIVQESGNTLFLKDTDGDDKADVRQVLIAGWGSTDTHAASSNQHYGLDNWIYGIVGYSGFNGTVGGEHLNFKQALYRFKPDGSKMEVLRNTSNNSWGVGITEEGFLFGSTANGNPSVHMTIPNRYYESVRGFASSVLPMIAVSNDFHPVDPNKVRQVDWHGKFTAGAGHAIYTARTYPQDYWNRTAFVCEPTGHLVSTFVLTQNGANFTDRYDWNLLGSDDEWTAPIAAEIGPDGNVWVIDWYNFIVQHNPTPPGLQTGKGNAYESPLRDKTHARIYRVVYKGANAQKPMSLKDADATKLVETLKNPNMFWRTHAQRLLVERGKIDVVPQLITLLEDPKVDAIGLNVGAIHAVGVLSGLRNTADFPADKVDAALAKALKHPSAGVVRNALFALPQNANSAEQIVKSGLLNDPDSEVRLAALLALSTMPASEHVAAATYKLASDSKYLADPILRDALICAGAKNDQKFLEQVASDGSSEKPAADKVAVVQQVAEHYARGGPVDKIGALLVSMSEKSSPSVSTIISGLAKGWPRNKSAQLSASDEKALVALMAKLPTERGSLVNLAQRLGSGRLDAMSAELAKTLITQLQDEKLADDKRGAVANELIDLRRGDKEIAAQLLEMVGPRTSPEFSASVLEAIGRSDAKDLGPALAEKIASLTPQSKAAAIRLLVARTDWTPALLDAVEKGSVSISDISLDQKQALANHPNRNIARRAAEMLKLGGGLPNADRQKVVDDSMPLLNKTGDAEAGKLVFTKNCAKCHTHAGAGAEGKVGPDLSGMAVHPKHDLLIDILDPSRAVEGTFKAYTLTTQDGRVLTGLLGSETKTSVEIVDSEAKRHTVLREDIEKLTASPKSLMPEGFEKQITSDDLVNLLTFLTQRSRFMPIPLTQAATVITTKGMFFADDSIAERIVFEDWGPKTFNGVQFRLIDPQGNRTPNAIMLYGPQGVKPPNMPRSVKLACNMPAKTIHMLGGISGWGFPSTEAKSVSLVVRLHYANGQTEDHELRNGVEIADYNGVHDVPGSKLAFQLGGSEVRYLAIEPKQQETIKEIELLRGPDTDATAPIVMAITVETPSQPAAGAAASTESAKGPG